MNEKYILDNQRLSLTGAIQQLCEVQKDLPEFKVLEINNILNILSEKLSELDEQAVNMVEVYEDEED